ncbi:MAG: hypothetical protein A2Y25_10870 [Candidatus Melainabacteria bacterium GWF2_37_15]|nr:MAG: hypothetical protein A2Y25_10870 [Candidatus Melainabacteria bacterium GWF2_37_15]
MKLAFVINVFREDDFHSGGERLFYELVNRAIQDGFAVDLYCTTYLSKQNILKNKLNKIVFLGHPKDFKYPHKIEKFYNEVKNLTQAENYDFVISENISPPLDIGILQGHSLIHYKKKSGFFFGLLKYKHIQAQKKWLKNQYRKIIVPSEVLKTELMENFNIPDEKFVVMYPGVDVPNSAPKKHNGIFTFGLSAPSFEKKGGYVFLKALKDLKDKNYIFRAKIIYPKYKKNLKLQYLLNKYGLRDRIKFLPYQENMQGFYNSINCVVMPSFLETFGLVALEGMANKIPAIVSHYCGASEIIKNGENGFIFDDNLAEKMELVLNKKIDYEKISRNAYETALQYNWEDFYKRFLASLKSL